MVKQLIDNAQKLYLILELIVPLILISTVYLGTAAQNFTSDVCSYLRS